MRILLTIGIVCCLVRAKELPLGLLPENLLGVLQKLDYLALGRLHLVCHQFHRYLNGIEVNWLHPRRLSQDEKGVLMKAIIADDLTGTKRILGNGPCQLNFDYGSDLGGRSVLMDVTKHGSLALLHLLVKHGLRLTDYRYLYALQTCMACKKIEPFKYLLDNRKDFHLIRGAERILCQACADSSYSLPVEVIRWLLEQYPVARVWINCQTYARPIHVARSLEIMLLLLEYGADPNARRSSDLRTKLHIVMLESVMGRPVKIRSLLKAGADATLQDKDGYTPLQLLMQNFPDVQSIEILTSESGSESGNSQSDQNKRRSRQYHQLR
jgi:hypothetical protein